MRFRLFGVDVEIQFSFWINALLLGFVSLGSAFRPGPIAVWLTAVLVSVLVHEYGHAFAIMRHRIEPEITLHWRGGDTRWRAVLPLRRVDHVLISLAGPFAGFTLAGLCYALRRFAPEFVQSLPDLGRLALWLLEVVNLYWGLINLLPVLPFDGGHVLEHALGPKRIRTTMMISFGVGVVATIYFLVTRNMWGALFFGMGAAQSYQQLQATAAVQMPRAAPRNQAERRREGMSPEAAALLQRARQALADEDFERAAALAEEVLQGAAGGSESASGAAAAGALEVLAWAHHLSGRAEAAEETARRAARFGPIDAALEAALLVARGDLQQARRVLEDARAARDDRKEIIGLLVKVLLSQGEVARAAAVALDVVDSLSDEDVRRMAEIAFDAGAYAWAGRLREAVFGREGHAEDAYAAAQAHAKNGEADRALALLRKAVAAGFSDRARAWSDAALESLRGDTRDLEAVVPRP